MNALAACASQSAGADGGRGGHGWRPAPQRTTWHPSLTRGPHRAGTCGAGLSLMHLPRHCESRAPSAQQQPTTDHSHSRASQLLLPRHPWSQPDSPATHRREFLIFRTHPLTLDGPTNSGARRLGDARRCDLCRRLLLVCCHTPAGSGIGCLDSVRPGWRPRSATRILGLGELLGAKGATTPARAPHSRLLGHSRRPSLSGRVPGYTGCVQHRASLLHIHSHKLELHSAS
jgi:hypothetical protein